MLLHTAFTAVAAIAGKGGGSRKCRDLYAYLAEEVVPNNKLLHTPNYRQVTFQRQSSSGFCMYGLSLISVSRIFYLSVHIKHFRNTQIS